MCPYLREISNCIFIALLALRLWWPDISTNKLTCHSHGHNQLTITQLNNSIPYHHIRNTIRNAHSSIQQCFKRIRFDYLLKLLKVVLRNNRSRHRIDAYCVHLWKWLHPCCESWAHNYSIVRPGPFLKVTPYLLNCNSNLFVIVRPYLLNG